VNLAALQDGGVGLLGRLAGASGRWTRFADDLCETCRDGEQRMQAVLRRIDTFAETTGMSAEIGSAEAFRQVRTSGSLDRLDLVRAGIRTVVWATGYRRPYPWLRVPVLDRRGEIEHDEGSTASPGLHVVGMRWQTRRDSSFLDGVRHDAALVIDRVLAHLGAAAQLARRAA
jgi:putative flavoprotein involved in K+ transport